LARTIGAGRQTMAINPDKLRKPARKLGKMIKTMRSQISPGYVHDLRTNIRRLEAILEGLQINSEPAVGRLRDEMDRLRKHAGKVRDMDVLIGYAASLHQNGEEECEVQLLERLGVKRQRRAKRLDVLVRKRRKPLLRKLDRTSKSIDDALAATDGTSLNGETSSVVAGAALTLLTGLTKPSRLNRTNLHPYRLKVKELRNLLKLSDDESRDRLVTELGELKDAIGAWHDWQELLMIGTKTLEHGRGCAQLARLRQTVELRYGEALKLANAFRKRNFALSTKRKSSRRTNILIRMPLSSVANVAA
jgi:CHAD domain-containing protein